MAIAKSPNSATKAPRKPAAKRMAKPAAAKAAKPRAAAPKAVTSKPAATKSAAPKAAAKAPARKPAASKPAPAPRKRVGLISAIALGIVAAGSAVALFGRRLLQPGNAEHEAPDLALDQPYPGHEDRAPLMFRPDPTADVPESEREGLRPATLTTPLVH